MNQRGEQTGVLARVAELVDALDLGSSRLVLWGFDSPLSHPAALVSDRVGCEKMERGSSRSAHNGVLCIIGGMT